MSEVELAKRGWDESAQAWVDFVERGDLNRTHVLDAPMLELCGDARDKRVLDVGCGEGRFSRMLVARGAKTVAIEPTEALVQAARERDAETKYTRAGAERLPFASDSFDLAICYLVLIDVPDFRTAIRECARVLVPGGKLVLANLNPFVTSTDGWCKDAEGRALHYPVDDYFVEVGALVSWANIRIFNWHRPMEAYMEAYLGAGLILESFKEPAPTEQGIREHPSLASGLRVPFFHVMRWRKP